MQNDVSTCGISTTHVSFKYNIWFETLNEAAYLNLIEHAPFDDGVGPLSFFISRL